MAPIGHVDVFSRFRIAGWAADEDRPGESVGVVILKDGREISRIVADRPREGLAERYPAASGRHGFAYTFNPPISPFRHHNVEVRVADSDRPIHQGAIGYTPVESHTAGEAQRPGSAILLSTSGRSGSTVLMGILAEHPSIVVAGERPFEVEMLCYYSYAMRALVSSGDHESSLAPDRITAIENRYKLGFNPFFTEGFIRSFNNRALFNKFFLANMPRHIGRAFREVILDFYAAVAADRGKSAPLYFAEKSLPEHEVRLGTRHLFGRVKEIVLVRDARDVVCSFVDSAGTDFNRTIRAVHSSNQRFLEIAEQGGPDVHFVRYEDLVLRPEETLTRLFRFLGLTPITYFNPSTMNELFTSHATSRSPAESIGRWRRELTGDRLEACLPFAEFLERFGYEPLPGGRAAADPGAIAPSRPGDALAVHPDPRQEPLSDLMLRFESLGENCEFGLVQRRCGIEPLGLLRFASAPLPVLLAALRARFEGLGQFEKIGVELGADGHEYMIHDTQFGFRYHAWALVREIAPDALRNREARRLPLLVRKLTEDLTEARKIFVYHGIRPLTIAEAMELLNAVRTFGPACLLWVELDDSFNPPGTVTEVVPGLFKGHINRFAPASNAHDLSMDGWVDVCRAAAKLIGTRGYFPADAATVLYA